MKHFQFSLISVLLLLLLPLQSHAYKKESVNITVNGQQRNMVVFSPNQLPAKSPLFIVTHGMNQSPEYQYDSDKMYEMIDTAKFVVTYLRSDGSTWDVGGTKDQNFVIKTIDEMVTRFDIDRDRVYWSGFSMGSMLIHHCIASMQDKIAAFAPTSGIQFSESPWNNCRKPVNLIECIAYGDDVFGYEQYGIHAYIENYAKHDNHTSYSKIVGYKPISSSWYDGDLERWTGGPNGGEVWLYSYNNGGHWPMDLNRHLIWNFCKRFSLNMPQARITQPAGETTHLCFAPQGEAVFPDIVVEATAKAQSGDLAEINIYDGQDLLQSYIADGNISSPTFTATLTAPAAGKHNLRVAATDSKGKTGEATCLVNYQAPQEAYSLTDHFTTEGAVPQDWYISGGTRTTTRVGGGLPYATGPRLLRFTNNVRAFDYGLLIQNSTGKERVAWAKFGADKARSALTLHPGRYALKYKIYNWDQPQFSPVTIVIEDTDGQEVASKIYTPTQNIGGNVDNKFSGIRQQTFEFNITDSGDYVIVLYADAVANADFVLGSLILQTKEYHLQSAIHQTTADKGAQRSVVHDLSGRRVDGNTLKPGVYIIDRRTTIIR